MEQELRGFSKFARQELHVHTILTVLDALQATKLGTVEDSEGLSGRRGTQWAEGCHL